IKKLILMISENISNRFIFRLKWSAIRYCRIKKRCFNSFLWLRFDDNHKAVGLLQDQISQLKQLISAKRVAHRCRQRLKRSIFRVKGYLDGRAEGLLSVSRRTVPVSWTTSCATRSGT